MDWTDLNLNQTFNARQTQFKTTKWNNYNVGNNLLNTRLTQLNRKIPSINLNMSLDSFEIKYKKLCSKPYSLNETQKHIVPSLTNLGSKVNTIGMIHILLH